MKKKIINGFLMVALLAATVTSFVSCKDNDEDVRTDLIAQIQAQKAALDAAYKAADAALKSEIQGELANKADKQAFEDFKALVESDYVTNAKLGEKLAEYATIGYVDGKTQEIWDYLNKEDDPNSVANRLTAAQTAIEDLQQNSATKDEVNAKVNTINDELASINSKIEDLQDQIDALYDAIKNFITSVTVNSTSTGILENSKLIPGLNMQFLGAVFGEADQAGAFPSSDEGDYLPNHGVVLTDAEIAGAEVIDWKVNDLLPKADEDGKSAAGTVYFTVNPSNISLGEGINLSLINSQDQESYVTLGAAKESWKTLSWGTRATYDVKLYEAPAYISLDDKGVAVVDPTEMINFQNIAQDVKDIFNAAKSVEKNSASVKATAKDIIKSTASIVANVAQAKIPALPALALKTQWTDTVGTRSVISDYSIAATAIKPLSFRFGKVPGLEPISLDRIDAFVARLAAEVKAKFPDMAKYIVNDIKINDKYVSVSVNVNTTATGSGYADVYDSNGNWIGYTNVTINVPINDAFGGSTWVTFNDIENQINSNFVNMINELIVDMTNLTNELGTYTERAVNATDKVTDYLEKFINRVIIKISEDGLTRAFEPILLLQGDKGVSRFAAATSFNAGKYRLVPTTITAETIVPLYKKYVAVLQDGKIVKAWNLTRGDAEANGFSYEFAKGNYTVVYAGLDFFGNQIAKRYSVNVQ